ncbi:MAG: MerR family transcriptional regulator [Treponema sp.]|nr:MerR family transcriptional regulator [Treponema sp.]
MKSYIVGEVARLLNVKPYVVRYWEQEIPLIQARRDSRGRHCYSERDVEIFIRLKYLLYERKFTVEGAREELYRELSGKSQDLHALVSDLRNELMELYFSVPGEKEEE